MKSCLSLILLFAASPAAAHAGHLHRAEGHDHWFALALIAVSLGIAVILGLRGLLRHRRRA